MNAWRFIFLIITEIHSSIEVTESSISSVDEPHLHRDDEPELHRGDEPNLHYLHHGDEPELHRGDEPSLHRGMAISTEQPLQLSREVETLLLDNIDSKLNQLEDLNVETIVMERHLAKFSGQDNDFNLTGRLLEEMEMKMINSYKEELDELKRIIISANHKLDSAAIKEVNSAVDNTEVFLEAGGELLESVVKNHVQSKGHKLEDEIKEKDVYAGNSEDFVSDYADLLTNQDEITKDEEETILKAIDKDLYDLDILEGEKKGHLKYISKHLEDPVGPSQELSIAKEVLMDVNSKDLKDYQFSLRKMKTNIHKAKGHLNLTQIDEIIASLERANIFLEVNKERIDLVNILDEGAGDVESNEDGTHDKFEYSEDQRYNKLDQLEAVSKLDINPIKAFPEKVVADKKEENSSEIFPTKYMTENESVSIQEMIIGALPVRIVTMIVILITLLLLIIYTAVRCKLFGSRATRSRDKFGEIGGIGSPSGDEKTNQFGCGNYKATAVVNDVNEADCDGKSKTWRDGWKNEGEKMRKQK